MTIYQPSPYRSVNTVSLRQAIAHVRTRPWLTLATLAGMDFVCLALAGILSVLTRLALEGQFQPSVYWRLWPVILLFIVAYGAANLYPAIAMSPVEELRRLTLTTTLLYLLLGSAIFLFREGAIYSRGAFLMAWPLSILFVIIGRYSIRSLCAKQTWWGYPVVVMGAGETGEMVIRALQHQPTLGLKPIAVLDDDSGKHGTLAGVPVVGNLSMGPMLARDFNIPYAIVAMPGVEHARLSHLLERYGRTFAHLMIIPNLFGMASLWVAAKDLGGVLGLEVCQQLFLPGPRLLKATLDKGLVFLIGLLSLPLIVLISLLIACDSPGPIFYRQTRIGRGGRLFKAWKFRSMSVDADAALSRYLKTHPELRACWKKDHKLKKDPRITRVGKFLRQTSLDELPQLWNVLCGEMSMVGPRPIVHEEVARYGDKFDLYLQVLPGLTGLWQVSGRNNVSYEERVNFDAYYVRNWSVWLDVYILIRTVKVVLLGDGAY